MIVRHTHKEGMGSTVCVQISLAVDGNGRLEVVKLGLREREEEEEEEEEEERGREGRRRQEEEEGRRRRGGGGGCK